MKIRNMNLSAREIMFSRMQNNNENILLDKLLSDTRYDNRKKANAAASKPNPKAKPIDDIKVEDINLHSLVFLKNDVAKDKSKVRDLYIVMDLEEDSRLWLQKVLHPFTDNKGEINDRQKYRVKMKDVYLAPSQPKLETQDESGEVNDEEEIVPPDISPKLLEMPQPVKSPEKLMKPVKPVKPPRRLMKFYELPGQDLNEDLEQIHDESVDKTVATYSPELQPQKSAKTYRRHRLNTFPQVSMKKLRSLHQHFSP